MPVFELVVALLLVGALLSAWARRLRAPYPVLLALSGAALALLPYAPSVTLDPKLALTLFVAPVLLDAAFDSSPRDLKENWRPVTGLALGAVVLTVVAVAATARWLVPQLPWAAAIALGAIVAPPDAAAATAVLGQLRPPHRLLVILQGESLFNDASALLVYRLAVAAAMTGSFSGWRAVPLLALVLVGSLVLGAVLSRLSILLNGRTEDVATAVIVQFLSTFAVWMIAEGLGLSGIITMVVFAILVARTAPGQTPARLRLPSYAVWEVAVFVLNVLAFILVGLQLKPILRRLDSRQLLAYLVTAAAICGVTILVRFAWVMGHALTGWWLRRRRARGAAPAGAGAPPAVAGPPLAAGAGPPLAAGAGPPLAAGAGPPLASATVIAWCGMRGLVTVAAALALPQGFPERDLVLFCAFGVVLGTLVLQGGTLALLMRLLALEDDGAVDGEVRRARAETARAALAAVDGAGGEEMTVLLRRKYEARLRRAERAGDGGAAPGEDGVREYEQALRRAQEAERRTLVDLRAQGVIGDDAFHLVEEELDWSERGAEAMARRS